MKLSRIAVVGCGEAGYEMHLPALALMNSVEVVGACDTDAGRRDRAASKFSVPVFSDYEQMLRDARPDVLIVATPPDSHTSICLTAIEAGCHLICEKPFVPNVGEGLQIMEAAERAGRRIALNHEFREMPIFRALLDETRRKPREPVFFASLWQNTDVPPWTEGGWRGAMLRRTLHEAGIHLIDYILALFGETPKFAWASMSAGGLNDSGSDALVVVSLEFAGGRIAQLVQNRLCKGETHYFEVRADTVSASYRASFGGRARVTTGLYRSTVPHLRVDYGVSGLAWAETGNKRRMIARNPPNPRVVSTRLVLERSLEAFENGGRPPATPEDALQALRVIDACYASAANGTRTAIE
ncbi:MAG TPA: Gfo/Idh/MocA family oxidoreductase [Gemmatimonadaceae bacterium]|nr:Gfo/Idh/MocA family oxidoreductase [Gemmatimonadaceae bacterium]